MKINVSYIDYGTLSMIKQTFIGNFHFFQITEREGETHNLVKINFQQFSFVFGNECA